MDCCVYEQGALFGRNLLFGQKSLTFPANHNKKSHLTVKLQYCDITGTTLSRRKCKAVMPTMEGFETVPLRLPDGKLLVAGSWPYSTDITLITTDGEPTFEKVGDIPGEARGGTSTVFIKDRFVVGFGGYNRYDLDDLWIFDLQTRQSSKVRKEREWHPADSPVPLVVQNDILYLVGRETISSLPLFSLADLIQDRTIRSAFRQTLVAPPPAPLPPSRSPPAPDRQEISRLTPSASRLEADLRERDREVVRLTTYLQTSQAQAARLLSENESLKRENKRLRAELEAAHPQDALLIRVGFQALPNLPRPPRWKLDRKSFAAVETAKEEHARTLAKNSGLLKKYNSAFAPLLGSGLPRLALSALAACPGNATHSALTCQLASSLRPGRLLPRGFSVPEAPLPRRCEKLLDSPAAPLAVGLAKHTVPVRSELFSLTPAVANQLATLFAQRDPLRVEGAHSALGRARHAAGVSTALYSAERAKGLRKAAFLLMKAARAATLE